MDLHRELGDEFELIWVLCEEFDTAHKRLLEHLGSVVEIAGLDFEEAARAVGRQKPQGIVSFVDDHIVIASEIAIRLGLPYHTPEVARVLADKRLQRAALARAGISGPRFWSFSPAMASDEFEDLCRRAVFPAVLKRAHGAGSRDMHAVASADQLREILSLVDGDHVWLLEEYVSDAGDHDPRFASYLSVESVVGGGRVSHAAVTGRFPLAEPFRETGNFIPGILPLAARGSVMEMVDATIAALQIENRGDSHGDQDHARRAPFDRGQRTPRRPATFRAGAGFGSQPVSCRMPASRSARSRASTVSPPARRSALADAAAADVRAPDRLDRRLGRAR